MLRTVTETKAELQAERGRVIAFLKSTEPGKISLAVPADRAVMTKSQAAELGLWLLEQAGQPVIPATPVRPGGSPDNWRTAERQRQEAIRRGLDARSPWSGSSGVEFS